MSEKELIERIDALKETDATVRAERQELESNLRGMIAERILEREEGKDVEN